MAGPDRQDLLAQEFGLIGLAGIPMGLRPGDRLVEADALLVPRSGRRG
jgi:hypothetical protein